jgi:hypothetical protein
VGGANPKYFSLSSSPGGLVLCHKLQLRSVYASSFFFPFFVTVAEVGVFAKRLAALRAFFFSSIVFQYFCP